tara:strand:+ start:2762 stop:3037 length:276 start_codon:yes stop_codon:yes gene_type:complete
MADATATLEARDIKVKTSGGDTSGEWVAQTINIVPTVGALRQFFNIDSNTGINIDGRRFDDDNTELPDSGERHLYVGWETNTKTGGTSSRI